MDRKGVGHGFLLVGSLALVIVWRLISGYWDLGWPMLWWSLGAMVGFALVFGDRLLMILTDTGEEGRSFVRERLSKGQLGSIWRTMNNSRKAEVRLPMRNFVFLFVYTALGFLAGFSSSNAFGRGLVWGMGLHLMFDLAWDYLVKKDVKPWYWRGSHELSEFEIKGVVAGFGVVFLLLTTVL